MRSLQWRLLQCRHLVSFNALQLQQQARRGWRLGACKCTGFRFIPSQPLSCVNHRLYSGPSFFGSQIDTGLSTPDCNEEAILERAKVHGIETLERLDFEANPGLTKRRSKRLLDDLTVRQDLDLWSVVLDYRSLRHGMSGIRSILSAMLRKDSPVKLQSDAVSEHIWRTILPLVLEDEHLLYEVCRIGSPFIQNRPLVFTDVVGQLLISGHSRLAIVIGTQHLMPYFRGRSDLLHIFNLLLESGSDTAMRSFCHLVARLPRFSLYADTVPRLMEVGRKRDAFFMHDQLLQLGDYPMEFDQIEPLIRELAVKTLPLAPFVRQLETYGISYKYQTRRIYTQERTMCRQDTGTTIPRSFISGPGSHPVKLNDVFVARTFATRSVSFDFVLTGLRFVGLFEIGPLAVREMALAAENSVELKRRFQQLEDMEIDLGCSNYVRVVKNLCTAGETELLQTVLESDMHYEVFEDVQKQKRLLTEYYQTQAMSGVDRTLAILSSGKLDRLAEARSAQFVIQSTLIAGDWRGLLIELDRLRVLECEFPQLMPLAPIRLALKRIWTSVDSHQRNTGEYLRRLLYLVGSMQQAQAAGMNISPWQWRSAIYIMSQTTDWETFCGLTLTILRMIRDESRIVTRDERHANRPLSFTDVFMDSGLQSLILEKSLLCTSGNHAPQQLWRRAADFLRSIRDLFKVDIDYTSISSALRDRLEVIFDELEIGKQRRLINLYLRQFNWAWSISDIEEKLPFALYQQEISEPDVTSLNLLQIRSRLRQERKKSTGENINKDFDQLDESHISAEHQIADTPLRGGRTGVRTQEEGSNEGKDSAVFYEDLLHPSYGKRQC